jgi:hypothetical protein
MVSFSALGDAGKALGKGISPGTLDLATSGAKALPPAGALKGAGGLTDALKGAGGLGDASKLLKGSDDLGAGVKGLAKAGDEAGAGAKGLAKAGDEAGAGAKGLTKADDAADAGKTAGKADDAAKVSKDAEGVLDWAKKNPGKAFAGAGASALAVYAATDYSENNGKKVGITKIEAGKEGGVAGFGATDVAKITFTPEMSALATDTLKIEGTDCTPSIDGSDVAVYKVYSKTQVAIKVPKALTAPGTKGNLTLSTSLAARAGAAAGSAASSAAGGAGGAAGGAASSFLQSLGISIPDGAGVWILGFCVALIVLFIIFKFVL